MSSDPTGDPWLKHSSWKQAVKYWQSELKRRPLACARCGEAIIHTPRTAWSLDVGHIVSRHEARALGWTVQQANAITNTQPEHAHCGRSAGAQERNARRRAPDLIPIEAGEW